MRADRFFVAITGAGLCLSTGATIAAIWAATTDVRHFVVACMLGAFTGLLAWFTRQLLRPAEPLVLVPVPVSPRDFRTRFEDEIDLVQWEDELGDLSAKSIALAEFDDPECPR